MQANPAHRGIVKNPADKFCRAADTTLGSMIVTSPSANVMSAFLLWRSVKELSGVTPSALTNVNRPLSGSPPEIFPSASISLSGGHLIELQLGRRAEGDYAN
jgi:hypothetical protein